MLTQEQKDFLEWENLLSHEIWVNLSTEKFYIQSANLLHELDPYFKAILTDSEEPLVSLILDDHKGMYPNDLFNLSDVEGLLAKGISEGYGIVSALEKLLLRRKKEVQIQAIVDALEYIDYHRDGLARCVVSDSYYIAPTLNCLVHHSYYLDIDLIDSDGYVFDSIGLYYFEDVNSIAVWFNYTQEQLNDFLGICNDTGLRDANLVELTNILELYYPNKYSIDLTGNNVILHWDQVEISNSRGATHTMYDFYIRLDFNAYFNKLTNMQGMRASFTLKEWWNSNPYTFSHLSTGQFGQWGGLCLGGTALANMFGILKTSEYSLIVMEAFLLQLNEYVRWESLEGGPYRGSNLANITYKNTRSQLINFNTRYLNEEIIRRILSYVHPVIEIKEESTISKGNFLAVNETPTLERAIHAVCVKYDLLRSIVGSNPYEKYKNFSTGETFFEYEINAEGKAKEELRTIYFKRKKEVAENTTTLLTFRGNPVRLKLIPEHFEETNEEKLALKSTLPKVLDPGLYNRIIDLINQKLFELTLLKTHEQYINNTDKQRELVTA